MRSVTLLLLLVVVPAIGAITLATGGKLIVAGSGKIVLQGANPESGGGGGTGWLNATMTSNTAPSPNVVTDDTSDSNAYRVFDHDTDTSFTSTSFSNGWVKFDFGAGNSETCNKIILYNIDGSVGIASFTFEGSNDDSAWTQLDQDVVSDATGAQPFTFVNATAYRYYRLWFDSYDFTSTTFYELELWNE